MHSRVKRPSHAAVVAYLALFVALGSGAYAATQLPENSVGTKQLRDRAVTLRKIKQGTRSKLRGPRGPKGAPCLPSKPSCRGPQGPGALSLAAADVPTAPNPPGPVHELGKVGPFDFSYTCYNEFIPYAKLSVTGPANSRMQRYSAVVTNDNPQGATVKTSGLVINGPTEVAFAAADGGELGRTVGAAELRAGTVDVHVDFHLILDARKSPAVCDMYGAAFAAG